jgi:hypothetical protein
LCSSDQITLFVNADGVRKGGKVAIGCTISEVEFLVEPTGTITIIKIIMKKLGVEGNRTATGSCAT